MSDTLVTIFTILGITVVIVGLYMIVMRSYQKDRLAWKAAAKELGLTFTTSGDTTDFGLEGVNSGCRIQYHHKSSSVTEISALSVRPTRETGEIPEELLIFPKVGKRPEGSMNRESEFFLKQISKCRTIMTGDHKFDESIQAGNDEAIVLATLNEDSRAVIGMAMRQYNLVILRGEVQRPEGWNIERLTIVSMINAMVKIAHMIKKKESLAKSLLKNCRNDSYASVRLRNMEALLTHFPDSLEASEVLEIARTHESEKVRFLWARNAGDKGYETLIEIAKSDRAEEELQCMAIAHLCKNFLSTEVFPLLISLLNSPAKSIRLEAIKQLGELKHRPSLEKLLNLLSEARDEDEAVQLITSIGKIGDPKAEDALQMALTKENEKVQVAAAEALGRFGTLDSVQSLMEYTEGVITDRRLKQAARNAIQKIQSRAGKVAPGRLSIAEASDEEGALSLSEGNGKLSVTKETD